MSDHNLREPAGDFGTLMEVRLLRWGESSTAGRTITLELHPDEGESHPFKAFKSGKDGQRFWMVLRPIADDEQPLPASRHEVGERPLSVTRPGQQGVIHTPDSVEESVLDGGAKGTPQPGCGPKVPRQWYDMPPSQRAGIMCGEKRFWIWLRNFRATSVADEDEATNWLYQECGINSRAELKLDTNASPDVRAFQREQLRVFYAVESEYRKWAGMEREVR